MSYLKVPRLHFAGKFIANISTVNNTASNYNPDVSAAETKKLFSPDGTGRWKFDGCVVKRVCYLDGSHSDDASSDPLVGQPVANNTDRRPASLVDLDPEQQLVSEIWGMDVQIGTSAEGGSVRGDYAVAPFFDMWSRSLKHAGDTRLSASYQSVLENLGWDTNGSRFLEELHSTNPELLSIKFNLDTVTISQSNGQPLPARTGPFGRIVGTIGLATADEPKHFVAGRLLRRLLRAPDADQHSTRGMPLYFAPCEVDEERGVVAVDMGNSIPNANTVGCPSDEGDLNLARLPAGEDPEVLGSIDYLTPGIYEKTAFVQEFPIGDASVADTPLGIVQVIPDGHPGFVKTMALGANKILLKENSDGSLVRADKFVFRLNPGDPKTGTGSTDFYVRRFGRPIQGETIDLEATAGQFQTYKAPPVNYPPGKVGFRPTTDKTDANGKVTVKFNASDPGNPRVFIDGQLYGVGYSWGEDEFPDPWNFISFLVHTRTTYSGTPTWTGNADPNANVQPILSLYAKLYPVMSFIDLSSYEAVKENAEGIQYVLRLPQADPSHMPVTRDLSQSKLDMILAWFESGMPEN